MTFETWWTVSEHVFRNRWMILDGDNLDASGYQLIWIWKLRYPKNRSVFISSYLDTSGILAPERVGKGLAWITTDVLLFFTIYMLWGQGFKTGCQNWRWKQREEGGSAASPNKMIQWGGPNTNQCKNIPMSQWKIPLGKCEMYLWGKDLLRSTIQSCKARSCRFVHVLDCFSVLLEHDSSLSPIETFVGKSLGR